MFERFTFPNYSNTLYSCQGDLLVFDSSNLDLFLSWYLLICESLNPPLPFVTTLIWDVDFGSTEMNLKICYTKKKKKDMLYLFFCTALIPGTVSWAEHPESSTFNYLLSSLRFLLWVDWICSPFFIFIILLILCFENVFVLDQFHFLEPSIFCLLALIQLWN